MVKLDSTRVNYNNTQNSGQDIRFTDSDGTTLLKHEIEKWDETGTSIAWVKVPQIDASSNTDYIYIYYGNSSVADGQDATNVWGNNSIGRWHFKDTTLNDGSLLADSSSNSENLSVVTGASTTTGQIGSGLSFSSSQYMRQKSYDSNQGTVSVTSSTLVDAGQDFSEWKTTSGRAKYKAVVKRTDAKLLTNSQSGTFTTNETITGGTSGATATVAYQTSSLGYMEVSSVAGTFYPGETVTGGTSGATAVLRTGYLYVLDTMTVNVGDSITGVTSGATGVVTSKSACCTNKYKLYYRRTSATKFSANEIINDTTTSSSAVSNETTHQDNPLMDLNAAAYIGDVTSNTTAPLLNVPESGSSAWSSSFSASQGVRMNDDYPRGTANPSITYNIYKADMDRQNNLTIRLWVKQNSSSRYLFKSYTDEHSNVGGGYGTSSFTTTLLRVVNPSGTQKDNTISVSSGSWNLISLVYSNNNSLSVYLNGSLLSTSAYTLSQFSDVSILQGGLNCFYGEDYCTPSSLTIDETGITNDVKSASWVAAEYKSEVDTFNTYASEEQYYPASGTLTSSIFDAGWSSNWGTLTYTVTTPTNTSISVKVRTSSNSDMSGATAFSSCTSISSGSDISSNSCVTDGQRYAQYQLTLSETNPIATPTFQDFSLTFGNAVSPTGSISINSGATYATSRSVTLTLSASDDVDSSSSLEMEVSENSDFSGASYEAFSASKSFTLSTGDGTKTVYTRFRDSASNVSSSYSDTIILDTTNPVSIDLDSPGDNSYTNSERPSFKWKATSDATSGLSKYSVEVDNGDSGDFTTDDIPTSRTTDYETNKYLAHYENFSDSDSTNNYISVYTKSTNDWGSNNNDGKLKEGKRSWKVKARDNAGNETANSRTLFVDRSGPSVEVNQINDAAFSDNLAATDRTPTIYGKATDLLAGDKTDNKAASGPKEVEIKFEKRNYLGVYSLYALATVNINELYWSDTGAKITDNAKNTSNKYSGFSYTPTNDLPLGTYKITLTGKDKADNGGGTASFTLTIKTFEEIAKIPEVKETIEELEKETKTSREKIEEIMKKQGVIVPEGLQQPSRIAEGIGKIIGRVTNLWWQTVDAGKLLAVKTGQTIASVQAAFDTTGKALALLGQKAGQGISTVAGGTKTLLASLGRIAQGTSNVVGQRLVYTGEKIGQGTNNTAKSASNVAAAIGHGYNQLANNAPGVAKTILTGVGNGVLTTGKAIASVVNTASNATITVASTAVKIAQSTTSSIGSATNSITTTTSTIAQNTSKTIGNVTNLIVGTTGSIAQKTGSAIASATWTIGKTVNQQTAKLATAWQATRESVTNPAMKETWALTARLKIATSTFVAIAFDREPTRILFVKIEKVNPTSAIIVWGTNHYATSAVNYGFDTSYGKKVWSDKQVKEHRMELTDLEPGKLYYFEVMSQNKNYVYDAYYTFNTPITEEGKVKGAATGKKLITIATDEGSWVVVRSEPSLKGEILAKVATGQRFSLLEEKDSWVKIKLDGQEGWVFGELVKIEE